MASPKALRLDEYLWINDECINCDMCVPQCPSESIAFEGKHYQINPATCIGCEDYYHTPTCIDVCPIDCILILPKPADDNTSA